jgi:hypothetical protein
MRAPIEPLLIILAVRTLGEVMILFSGKKQYKINVQA